MFKILRLQGDVALLAICGRSDSYHDLVPQDMLDSLRRLASSNAGQGHGMLNTGLHRTLTTAPNLLMPEHK